MLFLYTDRALPASAPRYPNQLDSLVGATVLTPRGRLNYGWVERPKTGGVERR